MPVTLETLIAVRTSPLLSELDDQELVRLSAVMDLTTFAKGANIFEQDTAGDSLVVIVSGQVGVVRTSAKDRSKERLLAVVGSGECIGEMALADGGARSATITALDDVKAVELADESYRKIRDDDPKLAIKLALGIFRLLSKRLRQINKNLEIVHYWMFA